ncbi:hypothetical protein N7453_004494 [Penicillium expansum]|nr:hypothetical protein N7453_004494 [Penicillium expansum]
MFYSKFEELDPLGPGVDLLSYKGESGTPQKVTFKYNVIQRPICLQMAWDEVNILKNLPPYLNTVPFDCVILEDVESQMIGFTTKYIPGGILANPTNLKVPFRFEWLIPFELGKTRNGEPCVRTGVRSRRTAMKLGQYSEQVVESGQK